jgi:pyridoxamine 5'-phosphate oxidase
VTTPIPELDDPLILAGQWLDEAVARATQPNPTAMTLATVDRRARPSARVVLVKRLDRVCGYAEFFTNYGSRKAAELSENAQAAGVMHWDHLGRQLRFEGAVVKSPRADSDAYFATRPWRSRINARVSEQSRHLDDPQTLAQRARQLAAELGVPDPFGTDEPDAPVMIERPDYWGGFRFWLAAIELWSSGTDRFHERLRYERSLEPTDAFSFVTGAWSHARLQP